MIGIGIQYGQAPPAVAPFDPTSVSGCKLWLRADTGVTLVGAVCSAWADQSGTGNNFTQGTDANRPTYNATGVGGKPSLDFDGSNDHLIGPLASTMMTATIKVIYIALNIIAKPGSDLVQPYNEWGIFAEGGVGNWGLYLNSNNIAWYTYDGSVDERTVAVSNGETAVIAAKHDGGNLILRKNAAAESSTASGSCAAAAVTYIGRGYAANYANIRVAEIIVYNASVSGANDTAIRNYLMGRYGL